MRETLPTISMLTVFEAVMAHGGFLRAAQHLNLSPPAVSYTIKAFERRIGMTLFERQPDGIMPTPHAASLVEDIRDILERMHRLQARASALGADARRLRILAPQAFASLWLLPRMGNLIESFPEWRFEIISWVGGRNRQPESEASSVDIEIRWAETRLDRRDGETALIVPDRAIAICAPRYLERIGGILVPAASNRVTAIHALNWPGIWQRWADGAFGQPLRFADEVTLQNTALCIQAAQGGLGIAVAHAPLVQRELATGSLVLAHDYSLPVEEGYFTIRHRPVHGEMFAAFTDWARRNMSPDGGT